MHSTSSKPPHWHDLAGCSSLPLAVYEELPNFCTNVALCLVHATTLATSLTIMADQDELYYLQPGFDVNTLTVPRLRSILVAHNISYPSSAKKSDLVEIVETALIPKARKLVRERDRVRRTSRGITDVPSSQEEILDDEDSDNRERMPPPPAPKTPRGRKSRTNLQQEEVEPTPKSTRRSKTPSTRRSIKTPRVSDAETTEPELNSIPQSARKTRKSTPGPTPVARTPSVRVKEAPDTRRSLEADESPFTQDNPFQQSSSPDSASRRVSSSRPRKSIGSSSTRKSTSRRRTKSPTRVKREEVEIPVSHLSTGPDGIETTEEFTEDAQQELSQDMVADRRIAKTRNKDLVRHKKKPASTAAKTAPWAVLFAALSAVAGWYRQEKVALGYCGVGQPQWSLAEVDNVPIWVHESLQPQCEPCPQHAICYPNMQVECEHDFVLKQHPLSLNGVIPLPPTCEPDSEKEKRIKVVADRAVEELRNKRAAYECGGPVGSSTTSTSVQDQPGTTVVSPVKLEVTEEQLKATISKQRRKNMSTEEFEDLWNSALGDITNRDEVEVTRDK